MTDLMQQAREQFEAWATSQQLPIKRYRWGEYKVDDTETAWEAWQAALRAAPECAWTYDTSTYSWDSACGEKWQFNNDGPAENNCRFCQGCGGRVAARPQGASDEQE